VYWRAGVAALAACAAAWLTAAPATAQQAESDEAAPSFLDAVPAPENKAVPKPGGSIIEDGATSEDRDSSSTPSRANVSAPDTSAKDLSPDDVAAIGRIESYLNELSTLRARFIQTSSDGTIAEGTVRLKRPGRMLFEYDPPIPITIVSNGRTLLYFDAELKQTTYLPLWETPLWFLVKDEIDISKSDLTILNVEHGAGVLRIEVTDREQPQLGTIALDFTDNPVQLRRWRVRDAQGTITQVSLVNPQFGIEMDSDVFDYSNLDLPDTNRSTVGN
jgi:outer membrane lipoprotein-sorting protein